MGRSTTSCFKIISCGGSNESVDRDDIDASSENKGRGWSFRKKSARHRVLSNTVITETPSENKETSESVTIISEPQVINSSISEKTPDNIWTEEIPQLSNSVTKDPTLSTIASESACEDDVKSESVPDESSVLVIQAAIRRFLAQRELIKHKKIVKLQAVVRGHLVRTHAVGTLRCVQAIVKVQALVRARQASLSAEKSSSVEKSTYVSMKKLLSNSLARQLLESTPKTKQINIKCDPLKSDSAWNWLERWMSVSTPETVELQAPEHEKFNTENQIETVISSDRELMVPSEEKENLISTEQNSDVRNVEDEKAEPEPTYLNACVPESMEKPDSHSDEPMQLNTEDLNEVNSLPEKTEPETEPKRPPKRLATDQPDSEGRKSIFGSRKASNPAFIAAQSRFEELTSKTNSPKPVNASSQNNEPDSSTHITPSEPLKPVNASSHNNEPDSSTDIVSSEPSKPVPEVEPEESTVSHDNLMEVRNGGSECGTELSITSTLDSPDQSDIIIKKFEEESKVVVTESVTDLDNKFQEEPKVVVTESVTDLNNKFQEQPKVVVAESVGEEHSGDAIIIETEKPKPANNNNNNNNSSSEADIEIEPESGNQLYYKSTEGSPRSHITVPESQGTPSSSISTTTKKSKSDKKSTSTSSTQKRKSWSTSKKSLPATTTTESSVRSSFESLPKESKPEKRRNSFGSPRPEQSGDEGRDSNSSIPSYMQATESARLKAIANSSPKSSPDVHDKETQLKKRHSLPGAVNGRQGSPRIQRSMSQALQTAKGNTNPERKWQR